jgi:hypothetical protein
MTEEDFQRSLGEALRFRFRSIGPEYYFWEGYLRGLRRNYYGNKIDSELGYNDDDDMVGDDPEFQGYRAGFAGLSAQAALAAGKKGVYRAGLNGNFHKSETDEPGWNVRALEKMGVIYQGGGKWTLPKGAKIGFDRRGRVESYYRCGTDWVLRLADGSEWIVWSEDIAGISDP